MSSSSPSRRTFWRNLLLTLPFLLLFYVQLAHHRLWRDELNAFGLAVASPTLGRLFHYVHYEGHPWLWYFLLWIVSKFTVYPVGMRVLEGIIGTASLLMVGLRSPFSTPVKVLLFLSYFVTFEYTVMERMYGVMLLLTLVYLSERTLHPERTVLNGALLGLIASTDSMGIILSAGLALEYGLSFLDQRRFRQLATAAAAYLVLLAGSLLSLRLSPEISWRTTGHLLDNAHDLHHAFYVAVSYVAMPYLPVLTWHLGPFWNPVPWVYRVITLPVFLLVLFTYGYTFRRERNLLIMISLVVAGSVAFGALIYYGAERHYGVTFLAFLSGLWILKVRDGRIPRLPLVLLALCAIGGVLTNIEEWRRPWSEAEAAAGWLQANGLADRPIAGTADTSVASIGEVLHRSIYQLDCNCSDTFMLFSRRRDSFSLEQIPARIVLARQRLGPSMLYIGDEPLEPGEIAQLRRDGLMPTLIKTFPEPENHHENYFIYSLSGSTPELAPHL